MGDETQFAYIMGEPARLPLHLQHRQPSFTCRAEMVLKRPLEQVCPNGDGRVQMAGAVEFLTRTTPGMLADHCEPEELHNPAMRTTHRFRVVYDKEIQRGVKETKSGVKESLRDSEITDMMRDIEKDQFECPQLMWNLRAGETVWAYLLNTKELRVYQGVATRPDTNHRHHAIIRFHNKYLQWVEKTESTAMGSYNQEREYGLVIYTDDFQGEAHRFYVYNFLGWRVSGTTAHYIESKTRAPALHAKLAREVMERSGVLGLPNVEIISNQVSRNSAKMITFGTFTDALKAAFPGLAEDNYVEILEHLVKVLEQLNRVRPNEIALLSVAQRQRARDTTLADQAVMWHGYFRLAACLRENAYADWQERLKVLAVPFDYDQDGQQWKGDVFSRSNPLWAKLGVLAPGKNGLRVVNNRQARQAAFETLQQLVTGVGPAAPFAMAANFN